MNGEKKYDDYDWDIDNTENFSEEFTQSQKMKESEKIKLANRLLEEKSDLELSMDLFSNEKISIGPKTNESIGLTDIKSIKFTKSNKKSNKKNQQLNKTNGKKFDKSKSANLTNSANYVDSIDSFNSFDSFVPVDKFDSIAMNYYDKYE